MLSLNGLRYQYAIWNERSRISGISCKFFVDVYIFNFDLYELFRLRFMCIKIMNKLRQCLICNVKFENKKIN